MRPRPQALRRLWGNEVIRYQASRLTTASKSTPRPKAGPAALPWKALS